LQDFGRFALPDFMVSLPENAGRFLTGRSKPSVVSLAVLSFSVYEAQSGFCVLVNI